MLAQRYYNIRSSSDGSCSDSAETKSVEFVDASSTIINKTNDTHDISEITEGIIPNISGCSEGDPVSMFSSAVTTPSHDFGKWSHLFDGMTRDYGVGQAELATFHTWLMQFDTWFDMLCWMVADNNRHLLETICTEADLAAAVVAATVLGVTDISSVTTLELKMVSKYAHFILSNNQSV